MTAETPAVRLSVIIPAYKALPWIDGCLDSHRAQEACEGVEWIVVDSGADGTAQRVAQRYPWVRLIASETQLNIAAARNRGVEEANGEWLAFTDQDVRVGPGWTAAILKRMELGLDYFGGTIVNGTPESRTGTADYFLCFGEYIPFKGRRDGRSYQAGANLVISRRLWERVGPMSETMTHGEDSEFGLRCNEAGATATLFGDMSVTHINRTDPEAFVSNQRRYGTGAAATRKVSALKGSFLVRRPRWIFLLPYYRGGVCLWRILRHNRALLLPFARCMPDYLRGLKAYRDAFEKCARSGDNA